MNENVAQDIQALEIPNALNALENKLLTLGEVLKTLEERLSHVCRDFKDNPDVTVAAPVCYTKLGQRIDRSVTSVDNAITHVRTILELLEI